MDAISPPCNGRLQVDGISNPNLFLHPIRFRQCTHGHCNEPNTDVCASTLGFNVNFRFSTRRSKPEPRIPFMYMPDALRAVLELSDAPKDGLKRCIYNIAAMSPTADEIADAARARIDGVTIDYDPDPVRQAILDSWPQVLDDTNARNEWGWSHEYDLDGMSDDLMPHVRRLVEELDERPLHV